MKTKILIWYIVVI